MSYRPYPEEKVKSHIKYVADNPENQEILNHILGEPFIIILSDCETYLEVNLNTMTWRRTFEYEWLYRNPPILIEVSDLGLEKPSYKGENPFKNAIEQVLNIEKEDMELEKNEIKKALYKQKPLAEIGHAELNHIIYSAEVVIDGTEVEVVFRIPKEETVDGDGNHIFSSEEPAQLLIRWLV